jgi:hypothetical protein
MKLSLKIPTEQETLRMAVSKQFREMESFIITISTISRF